MPVMKPIKITPDLYYFDTFKIVNYVDNDDTGFWVAFTPDEKIARSSHHIPITGKSPDQVAKRLAKMKARQA